MNKFVLNNKIELLDEEGNRTFGTIHDYIDGKLYVSTTPDEIDLKIFRIDDDIAGLVFDGTKGTAFEGTVTNRISGDLLIYEISNMENFRSVQRREDVRVPCSMQVYFTDNPIFLKADNDILYKDIKRLKKASKEAITADLSAGGMKISTKYVLEPHQEILLLFYIKDEPFIIKAEVLHKMINLVNKSTHYSYGIKFIDITEIKRESIISYLFVLMRKNRIR